MEEDGICSSCYETLEMCFHYTHRNRGEQTNENCVVCEEEERA
jgi:hypothetical protein